MSCQNADILALIDYYENGTDLSSRVWENYNFYDWWNAAENGSAPPQRDPCESFTIDAIRSVVFGILGTYTTPSEFLGLNRDLYYLYLKAIGQEDPSPVFDNVCLYDLYQVFTVFDPSQLSNKLFWLKAGENLTLDGSSITTWGDSFGLGNNFTGGNGTDFKPVYGTNQLNGIDIVSFNTQYLLNTTIQSECFVWVVCKSTNTSANNALMYKDATGGSNGQGVYYWPSGQYFGFNSWNADNYGVVYPDFGINFHIYGFSLKDGASNTNGQVLYIDNVLQTLTNNTGTIGTRTISTATGFRIGRGFGGWETQDLIGDIAEVIAVSNPDDVTSTDRLNVYNYLKEKYNL